jgi:hypothetical protein
LTANEDQIVTLASNLQTQSKQIDELNAIKEELSTKLLSMIDTDLQQAGEVDPMTANGAFVDTKWVEAKMDSQWLVMNEQARELDFVSEQARVVLSELDVTAERSGKVDVAQLRAKFAETIEHLQGVSEREKKIYGMFASDRKGI